MPLQPLSICTAKQCCHQSTSMLRLLLVNCCLPFLVTRRHQTPQKWLLQSANNCALMICIQHTTTSGMGNEMIVIESLRPSHPPTVHLTPRDAKVPLPMYPPNRHPLTQPPMMPQMHLQVLILHINVPASPTPLCLCFPDRSLASSVYTYPNSIAPQNLPLL